jgi:hypothetical protein
MKTNVCITRGSECPAPSTLHLPLPRCPLPLARLPSPAVPDSLQILPRFLLPLPSHMRSRDQGRGAGIAALLLRLPSLLRDSWRPTSVPFLLTNRVQSEVFIKRAIKQALEYRRMHLSGLRESARGAGPGHNPAPVEPCGVEDGYAEI